MKTLPPHTITYEQLDSLTAQEYRVLRLALQEYTCKDIAEALTISPKTAETHRKNILKKLGVVGKVAFRQALRQIDRLLDLPGR